MSLEPKEHVGDEAREQPPQLTSEADNVQEPAVSALLLEAAEQQVHPPTPLLGLEGPVCVSRQRYEQPRPVLGDAKEQLASRDLLRQVNDLHLAAFRWGT
jgi:hypothetical protein